MSITYLDEEPIVKRKITYLNEETIPTNTTQRPSALAVGARYIMRNIPTEQLKTGAALSKNIPDVTPGEGFFSYQKKVAKSLQPRETEIAKEGTVAQFKDPIALGLAASGIKNPLAMLKGVAKFGVLEGAAELTGINKAIQGIKQPELRDVADIAKVGAEGALASKSWEKITPDMSKLAGRINNSLIKPKQKDFLYGKNPGMAVAKEKIYSSNLPELKTKVDTRLTELNKELDSIFSIPQNVNKKINTYDALQPLYELRTELIKAPKTNASAIAKVDNILSDIQTTQGGKFRKFNELSPSQARELKQFVSDFQDWAQVEGKGRDINIAIRKVYHNIDNKIDTAIPTTKLLNERIANLITASKSIESRIGVTERANLLGLSPRLTGLTAGALTGGIPGGAAGYVGGILAEKALSSPLTKTFIASRLAKPYSKGMIPTKARPFPRRYQKQEPFSVEEKSKIRR